MKRKLSGFLIILILLTLLSQGCWSRKEMTELAIILGAAVDLTPDGQYIVTAQFSKPGNTAHAQQSGGGTAGAPPVWIASASGDTVFSAERNLATQVSRNIYWGHCVVVILGEKVAQKGLRSALSFFMRSPQPREAMWVMVAKGEAKDLLFAQPGMENTSAQSIGFLARAKTGFSVDVKELVIMLAEYGNEPIAPRIETSKTLSTPNTISKSQEVKLSGVAAFKDDKLVGWLDETETRGLLWLRGEVGKGVITVPSPDDPQKNISLDIIRASAKITPKYSNGKVSFQVKLVMEGDLEEGQGTIEVSNPDFVKSLEKAVELDTKARAEMALHHAQTHFKSDIFGFGQAFHRSYKKEWRNLEKNWNETFANADVQITVKAFIRRTGLISDSSTKRE